MAEKKYNLIELKNQSAEWKDVCVDFMKPDEKEYFLTRKKAVDMYIEGISLKEISRITSLPHQRISKLIELCIDIDPITGKQYGYEILICKRKKIKTVGKMKNTTEKSKGSFESLLLKYPTLRTFLEEVFFNQNGKTLSKNTNVTNLHHMFLEECRKLKIQDYEYPFISKDKAQRTFYSYMRQLENSSIDLLAQRQNKDIRQKLYSTGMKQILRPVPLSPYAVIQIDGHKIDMLYTVEVRNKHDEIILMPATRMWLIAVIDVATRTVLGYSLTTNENYNQSDVLRAIRSSIIPKATMDFTLKGLNYPDNYGYASLAIPELSWAMPETIMLDNAKSHLAENTINKLCSTLKCSLNYGSVATPETRGIIERLFGTLEESGYHRLPSTTGSNINDTRRTNSENDAIKYQIRYNDILQLTEYFIALYNNSPHTALDNQTPIECMRRRVLEAGMMPSIAIGEMRDKVYRLTSFTELKTVRGSVKNGKRPYITYKCVEYRNDILSQSMGLIGQKLIIEINPDDIHTVIGYFESGAKLGILTAIGEWGRKSHSLKTREEAIRMANYNKQNHSPFYAPLSEYEAELNERALQERRARTKASRIRTEQEKSLETNSPKQIVSLNSPKPKNLPLATQEELAIKRKMESYTKEEMEAIRNAGSLEEAFNQGLI
jgi:transposase InsO family protein